MEAGSAATRSDQINFTESGRYTSLRSRLTELAFDDLDAPPVTAGARNWITPSFELERDFFPQSDWIIDAVHQKDNAFGGTCAGE